MTQHPTYFIDVLHSALVGDAGDYRVGLEITLNGQRCVLAIHDSSVKRMAVALQAAALRAGVATLAEMAPEDGISTAMVPIGQVLQ